MGLENDERKEKCLENYKEKITQVGGILVEAPKKVDIGDGGCSKRSKLQRMAHTRLLSTAHEGWNNLYMQR